MDSTTVKEDPVSVFQDRILSAQELFKYRKPFDKTVPNRSGGTKDFEPDGSFLQVKWLENLSQERAKVLREQRVERKGGLVNGEWNSDLQLVELEREMGKFWTYMGFVDSSRKWLYPEEALFLMETNTLAVKYRGLPLSIQQAYACFLGSAAMTTECYQVYAHLRRLGYVVLRHQGRLDVTKYERKIHLDQHVNIDQKKRKHKGKAGTNPTDSSKGHKKVKVTVDESVAMATDRLLESCSPNKQDTKMEVDSSADSANDDKSCHTNTTSKNSCNVQKIDEWTDGLSDSSVPYSVWNFDSLAFPNIGDSVVEVVDLWKPTDDLLPPGVDLSSAPETFDVRAYRTQKKKSRPTKRQQESTGIEHLEFSYAEMIHKQGKITASNWGEYKKKMADRDSKDDDVLPSPANHLWQGEVTPLVRPSDATSTVNILSRLQIVGHVNLTVNRSIVDTAVPEAPVFDVYLPDAKFRKSQPGIPNYRICVSRNCERPPSLKHIVSTQGSFADGVPISWAVIDHGDIAFYQFSDISLPVDIPMG